MSDNFGDIFLTKAYHFKYQKKIVIVEATNSLLTNILWIDAHLYQLISSDLSVKPDSNFNFSSKNIQAILVISF